MQKFSLGRLKCFQALPRETPMTSMHALTAVQKPTAGHLWMFIVFIVFIVFLDLLMATARITRQIKTES